VTANPLPPYWLTAFARELKKRGVSPWEAPRHFIRESARRIESGDLETGYWELNPSADVGMGMILSLWTRG
jgi:hypothetical protein